MQSEASEVTLGGKAHVGPGCVCATRHQPSWLDRGISVPAILSCVPSFSFHDHHDHIGRCSPELGASGVFSVVFTVYSVVLQLILQSRRDLTRRRDVGSGSARPTRRSVHQVHDWTVALRPPAAPWGTGTGERRSQVQVHSGGTGRAENSCRAPICRNERDRVCRGGGWWRLQESPRLSLAGGPGGKSGAVVRVPKRGKKGPPVPPLPPSRPPIHAPPLHTCTPTPWHQGPSRDRVAGSRGQVGLGEGRVRAWADGQGRGGTGMRTPRWEGWLAGWIRML